MTAPHAIADTLRALALDAGAATLAHFRRRDLAVAEKSDASPVTVADRAADAVIAEGLAAAFPDIPLVSEERTESHDAIRAPRYFLVDPLDGTREFIGGSGEYTVNIALVEEGRPVLGAVVAPAVGRLFYTPEPGAAVGAALSYENGAAQCGPKSVLRCAAPGRPLRVVASRSHRDDATNAFIAELGETSVVSAGSSLKFCLIAAGDADIYPRFGRTMLWDTAAADAVLCAAGGQVDAADRLGAPGGALRYGPSALDNPAFVAYAPGALPARSGAAA